MFLQISTHSIEKFTGKGQEAFCRVKDPFSGSGGMAKLERRAQFCATKKQFALYIQVAPMALNAGEPKMDHYQKRFKTIPDANKEELARTVVGMFPFVLDSLYRTGDELSHLWQTCIAPMKKNGYHVDDENEDPTAEDAETRDTIKECFEILSTVEEVLTELGMSEWVLTKSDLE